VLVALTACTRSESTDSENSPDTNDVSIAQAPGDAGAGREQADRQQQSDSRDESEAQQVSYSRDVRPIFVGKCISCHHDNNAVRVILTDPFHPELGIINRENSWKQSSREYLVVPGEPEESALMLKVTETDLDPKIEGNPMPWDIPYLGDDDLADLAAWINAGAENNDTFRRVIVPIFGDGVSLGRRSGNCAYCHHPWEGRYEPNLVDPFDPNAGAVNVESAYGGLRIDPGSAEESVVYLRSNIDLIPPRLEPPMPLHYERLTGEEVSALREWILIGAPNN
jgi:cytochrome c553